MQGPNQLISLVQNRYVGFSRKYFEPFFTFPPNPKIKGNSHKKKIEHLDFLKKWLQRFNKMLSLYSTFETHNITVSIFTDFLSPKAGSKPTPQSRSNSIYRVLLQISRAFFFSFPPNPKIKGRSIKK